MERGKVKKILINFEDYSIYLDKHMEKHKLISSSVIDVYVPIQQL